MIMRILVVVLLFVAAGCPAAKDEVQNKAKIDTGGIATPQAAADRGESAPAAPRSKNDGAGQGGTTADIDPQPPTQTEGQKSPAAEPDPTPSRTDETPFAGWPKPEAVVLISGELLGFMEPCGCSGLENKKGGLGRRHSMIKSIEERGWPVVAVDLGGQVRRFGRQAEIKFNRMTDALVQMGYAAVALGPEDLRLPAESIVGVAANLDDKNPFTSANVGLFDFDAGFVLPTRVIEAGGRKIGITSILGDQFRREVVGGDVVTKPAAEALREVVPKLKEQADFLILLSHATPDESKALAEEFPEFDVVVTAGLHGEPSRTMAKGKPPVIEVGDKGMYVIALGLTGDAEQPILYQRLALTSRIEESPEMQQLMTEYQRELEQLGFDGLDLKPQAHPSGRQFVGSETCGDCHTQATEVWENTPHAHALQTLVDLKPQRQFDPECLSCHVTGWEPQKYFPYTSGYLNLDETAHLRANGCENCHGPGSHHVAAESDDIDLLRELGGLAEGESLTSAKLDELRDQMKLPIAKGEGEPISAAHKNCLECHDLDNSPDFDFETYWEEVKHYGKD